MYKCPNCQYDKAYPSFAFCPNCGLKLEGHTEIQSFPIASRFAPDTHQVFGGAVQVKEEENAVKVDAGADLAEAVDK